METLLTESCSSFTSTVILTTEPCAEEKGKLKVAETCFSFHSHLDQSDGVLGVQVICTILQLEISSLESDMMASILSITEASASVDVGLFW